MASKIQTLYEDSAKTNAILPRTKVEAISDINGTSLQSILNSKIESVSIDENTVFNISGLEFKLVKVN